LVSSLPAAGRIAYLPIDRVPLSEELVEGDEGDVVGLAGAGWS